MREADLVGLIRKWSANGHSTGRVIRGIGDDCAVVRPRAGEDLVFTTDFVLEGRHFTRETHSAADVGHKALARGLSDLAAMGSEPVFCLISLALPAELTSRWAAGFYRGLLSLARKYQVTLAGGDLARFEQIVADVICCGRVRRNRAILRSGAKPGDQIYVTGELGGSALGLRTRSGNAWRRHLRPEPRITAGLALQRLRVSAGMDLSDGLSLDLQRLCLESGVSAEIDSSLPIAKGATEEDALNGGEDYELLFTVAAKTKVPKELDGVRATRIGTITRGNPGRVVLQGRPLPARGFDHFA